MLSRRSDLAMEARRIWNEDNLAELEGAEEKTETRQGFPVTSVRIFGDRAAEELCKPKGRYVTVELGRFLRREDDSFEAGAQVIAQLLRELLGQVEGGILVAGLGNPAITPDAVGHLVVASTLVTRHLKRQMGETFAQFGDLSALEPGGLGTTGVESVDVVGVLGTTGVESVDVVGALVREIRPAALIAVDALASRSVERVCRTVQIADSGIVPGSGVGNARGALSRASLGIPVIALGVPTVVDAATLTLDVARQAGVELDAQALRERSGGMIVTPREIDAQVRNISRLMAYGINLAVHPGLTVSDVDMFLG